MTDEFSEPLAVVARSSYLGDVRALLPIVLVGIGIFVFGGLIFIGVLLRRRAM
ncbi:MAG TPA: hypothetical protein VGP31_05995 [Planosporangium sp.]|nr:hypothetical protein [Planosporangium sp.]